LVKFRNSFRNKKPLSNERFFLFLYFVSKKLYLYDHFDIKNFILQLLLIVDSPELLSSLPAMDALDNILFDDIRIDVCVLLDHSQSEQTIASALDRKRYHLVLSLCRSISWTPYDNSTPITFINLVNNYQFISEEKLDFVVNKTTSYFNVFLEIPKGVSLSSTDIPTSALPHPSIKRIDSIGLYNYTIAYYCHAQRANYYILNYNPSEKIQTVAYQLRELLIKIG